MKRVLVKSVFDAFEYVMQHYYPAGLEEMAERSDSYAVISIQDSHTDGFGVRFSENKYCQAVLTLIFDDIMTRRTPKILVYQGFLGFFGALATINPQFNWG